MNIKDYMQTIGKNARAAARLMAMADSHDKNSALTYIADAILERREALTAIAED